MGRPKKHDYPDRQERVKLPEQKIKCPAAEAAEVLDFAVSQLDAIEMGNNQILHLLRIKTRAFMVAKSNCYKERVNVSN